MQTATDNLMQIAAELNAAGKQVKVTVLKPRKARRSELIMSSTKGVRTNTNLSLIHISEPTRPY